MLAGESMALFVSCSSGESVSKLAVRKCSKLSRVAAKMYSIIVSRSVQLILSVVHLYPSIWRHLTSPNALSKGRTKQLRISHTELCARKSRAVPNRFS